MQSIPVQLEVILRVQSVVKQKIYILPAVVHLEKHMLKLFIAEIMGKRMFFGEIFVLKLCATDMEYLIFSCCYGWPAIKTETWCNQTANPMIIATSDQYIVWDSGTSNMTQ